MKKSYLLLSLISILVFSSCTTQSYVSSFSKFVDKTDAKCHNYSINQWKKNIAKFKDYSITRFYKEKSKLTSSQIKDVLRLDARYIVIVSSQGVIQVKNLIDEVKGTAPEMIGSFVEELLKKGKKK
jgi:hypothetical protein